MPGASVRPASLVPATNLCYDSYHPNPCNDHDRAGSTQKPDAVDILSAMYTQEKGDERMTHVRRLVSHARWMMTALAICVFAAACGSASTHHAASTSGTSRGSGASTGHNYKGTLKVGLVADLTGAISRASDIEGALAYFDSVNRSGGVDGYKIVPVEYDTQSSPGIAVQAFRRAIASNPKAILGMSYDATPALPTLAASGIPAVGDGLAPGWTGHPTLFPIAGDWGVVVNPVPLLIAKERLGTTKVALVGSPRNAASQQAIERVAPNVGVDIVAKITDLPLAPTSPQYLSTAEQIAGSGARAAVDFGVENFGELQVNFNQLHKKIIAITNDPYSSPSLSTNGLIFSAPWVSTSNITGDVGMKEYASAMRRFGYGSDLANSVYAPFRWAQAALLVRALRAAAPPFSHTAVVKALSETKNFTADGVVPPTSFPKAQHSAPTCQGAMQVVDGKWKSLLNGPHPFVCEDAG